MQIINGLYIQLVIYITNVTIIQIVDVHLCVAYKVSLFIHSLSNAAGIIC